MDPLITAALITTVPALIRAVMALVILMRQRRRNATSANRSTRQTVTAIRCQGLA